MIRIGPQVTLVESDDGKLRMWDDDPSQEAPRCESRLGCWFNWVELVAGVAVIAPRNITDGAETAGPAVQALAVGRRPRWCAMLEWMFLCRGNKEHWVDR